jgi:hypothetical protein
VLCNEDINDGNHEWTSIEQHILQKQILSLSHTFLGLFWVYRNLNFNSDWVLRLHLTARALFLHPTMGPQGSPLDPQPISDISKRLQNHHWLFNCGSENELILV